MRMNKDLLDKLIEYNKQRKNAYKNNVKFEENKDFERILKARYNKVTRIKQHFIYMIMKKKNIYFLTFTFDDHYIKKCDRTKKDLIKNLLKDIDYYAYIILNKDFGGKFGREHYHCLYGTNKDINLRFLLDKYYPCICYTQKVSISSNSIKKLSKYINKLTNHAVKSSTNNSRLYFNFKGYGDLSIPEVKQEFIIDKFGLGL